MAYQIIWSDEAQEDVRAILLYLIDAWNDKIADSFSEKLIEVSQMLEQQPFTGQRNRKASAVRHFPVKPYYMIEYTVIKHLNIVYILNVLDVRKKR